MRWCSLMAVVWAAGVAVGQQPYPLGGVPYYPPPNSTSVRPPLSPYLNLLNGVNPALNYYYGVRPYTAPPGSLGSYAPGNFAPGGFNTGGGGSLFVQPTPPPIDPLAEPDDVKKFRLPPPGNPVGFGNRFGSSRAGVVGPQSGYYSGPVPQGGRGSQTGGQPAVPQGHGVPTTIPRSR
jgi:hypothetical protein